jgi:apoptosis-inducing factor 3
VAYFPYQLAPGGKPAYTRIEHYDVAMDQGRVAAKGMMGWKVPLRTVPFFWTAQYGKSLRYAGHAHATDNVILHGDLGRGDKAEWTAFFVQADAVAAVATFNRDPEAVAAMELLKLGAMPAPSELASASAFDLTQHLRAVTIAAANKKKAAAGK